ncbi:MAG: hypothetical protein M3Z09_11500, partial [Acidobacteriota bacterium]|nr:hypothetical protein [Acidobacteriota bacterium]
MNISRSLPIALIVLVSPGIALINAATPISFGGLPLRFEINKGQADSKVQYLARGSGYSVLLTPDAVTFNLRPSKKKKGSAVSMLLIKADKKAAAVPSQILPTKSNYFRGKDSRSWMANLDNYGRLTYSNVNPGIDAVYYGTQGQLEYDFVVAAGSDPSAI